MIEQLYEIKQPDPLGVLSSTREVVLRAKSVRIEPMRIRQLALQLTNSPQENNEPTLTMPAWPAHYHFFDGTERTVNWILLLDALNFCFWAEKNQPRWQVTYQGELLNGYWAEAAALRRAMEEGQPLWNAEYLSNMDHQGLASILRGISPDLADIPLFEERLRIVREVGQVLLDRFKGQFSHLVEQVQGRSVELVIALAKTFPSFWDVANYESQEVFFFKRAQICVSDLHGSFQGKSWGAFADLDQLTIFADYKLPQVLCHYGGLIYTPQLAKKIEHQELLQPGSAEEVEIRSATIWGSELLRRELAQLVERAVTAAEVDQLLWHLGQDAANMQPYHRVRTIFY